MYIQYINVLPIGMFCVLKNLDVHEKSMNCKKTGTILIPVTASEMLPYSASNGYSYNMVEIKGPITKGHEIDIP